VAEATRPFGDYELLGEIERGGMGVVYRARERHSGRLVALKMMLGRADAWPVALRRFILEARATGEVNHPGIVAIHAWGEHDGCPFYTMDFIPGTPLSRLLRQGPLPCARAVRYLSGIARAVAAAHARGIVHRDLKPGNVIIDAGDQPRVLDFGLAKRHRPEAVPEPGDDPGDARPVRAPAGTPAEPSAKTLAPLTEEGAIVGTPAYMAPEQVRAQHDQVGPPADVHALGAIFYEMLTGRPPYQTSGTALDAMLQVLDREPTPVRMLNPAVPASLEKCCHRCLAKGLRQRYADAGVLADDLEKRWHRSQQSARFARYIVMAGIALVLIQVLRIVTAGWMSVDLEPLSKLLGQPGPQELTRATSLVGIWLLGVGVFDAMPLLLELGLLVWVGAWVWHADRPWLLCGGWGVGALAALILNCLAGPAWWPIGFLLAAWLPAAALTAVVVAAERARAGLHWGIADVLPGDDESYLQRLFTRRVESPAARSHKGRAAELTDLDLGKLAYAGECCEVRWARQKSLDRPVLVWRDSRPLPEGAPLPGVMVRHPCVLGLHAVGASPPGYFLVTEAVTATPLVELVPQRGLVPAEAAALAAKLAHALQAFHDQGACHGQFGPEWVLLHDDLEPLLCPCGVPSQSAEDRARDVQALGRLLRGWLPRPPWDGRYHPLAALYRVADAAIVGEYRRAADLAADLEQAARVAHFRWRQRWAHVGIAACLLLPLLALGLDRSGVWLVLGLCPGTLLLGYLHGRTLAYRLRQSAAVPKRFLGGDLAYTLGPVALVAIAAGLLLVPGPFSAAVPPLTLLGGLLGWWSLGLCLAGLVTFGELLLRSVQGSAKRA
jgi:serine/threonine protein kinase